jgi:hypothetical protein
MKNIELPSVNPVKLRVIDNIVDTNCNIFSRTVKFQNIFVEVFRF